MVTDERGNRLGVDYFHIGTIANHLAVDKPKAVCYKLGS